MKSKGQLTGAELKIESALGAFLRNRQGFNTPETDEAHLDEDLLTAFVEGNLGEAEAKPVVSHLADCSFCLRVSAELVRLDAAFAEETPVVPSVDRETQGVSDVLGRMLSRLFGPEEGTVFAHEEKPDSPEGEGENEEDEV